jgi:hypothetical protein
MQKISIKNLETQDFMAILRKGQALGFGIQIDCVLQRKPENLI